MENLTFKHDDVVFWSDTHFGHQNIIKYCTRPFEFSPAGTEAMDLVMLDAFREADEAGKTIFHLGDFVFRPDTIRKMSWRPRGEHYILLGNHDKHANDGGKYRSLYHEYFRHIIGHSDDWKSEMVAVEVDDVGILLSHEPQKQLWGRQFNFYGHHHNNMMRNPSMFLTDYGWLFDSDHHINVGVELTNYHPITVTEALALPKPHRP
jgi:calcineurin-like phosphoesterase family protein